MTKIDVNLWNADVYGNGEVSGAVATGYPLDESGEFTTVNTSETLFSVEIPEHVLAASDVDDEWLSPNEIAMTYPQVWQYLYSQGIKPFSDAV